MIPQINCVGLIKETRTDESRTPLTPIHIKILKKKYPHIDFIVQSSEIRAFDDKEYENCGAKISDNLSNCDIIFGVKEIDPNYILKNKTYIFFSHTYKLNKETLVNAQGTPGMDKKELLKSIIKNKATLIDYENIRDRKMAR